MVELERIWTAEKKAGCCEKGNRRWVRFYIIANKEREGKGKGRHEGSRHLSGLRISVGLFRRD